MNLLQTLTVLREEDVTATIYKDTYRPSRKLVDKSASEDATRSDGASQSKVNRICQAFIDVLRGKEGHTQNLISAYVCQNPPNLDDGLRQIARMRGMVSVRKSENHVLTYCSREKRSD